MHNKSTSRFEFRLFGLWLLVLALAPRPAFAHHAMGGITPRTFAEGLLSGFAHPVIGVDHLAFVLLAGAYAGLVRQQSLVVAFIIAAIPGCLLHVHGFDLPLSEKALASSLLLVSVLASAKLQFRAPLNAAVFAICGILHGYAYGESIVGSEPAPLVAYLVGFTLIQLVIAGLLGRLVARLANTHNGLGGTHVVRVLAAGAALAGVVVMMQ